jgi:NADH-quinone oxidoreductase subunit I
MPFVSPKSPGDRTGSDDVEDTTPSPRHGLGRNLIRGLVTTAKVMARPVHTAEYPDVRPSLPSRTRGVIALLEENCTACMLCAKECPDWAIVIESHKETIPAVDGGRARQRNVLDSYTIDFGLCMYCGICVEVCPFDALHWSPEFEYAEFDLENLRHGTERLGQWMATVPPPPQPDPGNPEPKEIAQAARAAAKALDAQAKTAGPAPEATDTTKGRVTT